MAKEKKAVSSSQGKFQQVKRDCFSAAAARSSSHAAAAGSVFGAAAAGALSDPGSCTCVVEFAVDRGFSHQHACEELKSALAMNPSAHSGFYIHTNPVTQCKSVVLAIEQSNGAFQIYKPNTGRLLKEMGQAEIRTCERMSPESIRDEWTSVFDLTLNHCMHGPTCKKGANCKHGHRLKHMHVLIGNVRSHLHDLQRLAHCLPLTKHQRRLKPASVVDEDGRIQEGMMVKPVLLDNWLEMLADGDLKLTADLAEPAHAEPPKPLQVDLVSKYTDEKSDE